MTFIRERTAWEIGYWTAMIRVCKGNIVLMAEHSGYSRTSIYVMLHRLDLLKTLPGRSGRYGNRAWRSLEPEVPAYVNRKRHRKSEGHRAEVG